MKTLSNILGAVLGAVLGAAVAVTLFGHHQQGEKYEPAKYHHGQSNTGWQQLNTANANACYTYMPPADVVRCLIATGAAI
jgi:hypothetical protein